MVYPAKTPYFVCVHTNTHVKMCVRVICTHTHTIFTCVRVHTIVLHTLYLLYLLYTHCIYCVFMCMFLCTIFMCMIVWPRTHTHATFVCMNGYRHNPYEYVCLDIHTHTRTLCVCMYTEKHTESWQVTPCCLCVAHLPVPPCSWGEALSQSICPTRRHGEEGLLVVVIVIVVLQRVKAGGGPQSRRAGLLRFPWRGAA